MMLFYFFFFNDTATTEIYTLSLHDALPISSTSRSRRPACGPRSRRRDGEGEEARGDPEFVRLCAREEFEGRAQGHGEAHQSHRRRAPPPAAPPLPARAHRGARRPRAAAQAPRDPAA